MEAAEANRAGILGEDSLKRLGSLAIRLVGKDPGVLDEEKRVLNDALRTSPRYDGLAYHTVAQLVERIDSEYALRWATALSANPPPEPERTARRLLAFCELEWDPTCLRPETNPAVVKTASNWQTRQPIYGTSVERWRCYEQWIAELRELL